MLGPDLTELRVLIVDDHAASREALRTWLRLVGWQAETVGDGEQAMQRAREVAFDVVIVDLDLPSVRGLAVSGWDVVRRLRVLAPRTSIIVVSAQCGSDVRSLATRLQVLALLEKPLNPPRLHALVRALEARRGLRRDAGGQMSDRHAEGSPR